MTHTTEDYERHEDGLLTDYAFYATVLAGACLVVELVNLGALAYILHWTASAGANIVGKISQSLGLKQGKGSIIERIGGIVEKARENPSATGNDEPIDIPGLGSFTPSQIKAGAQAFLGKAKAGEVEIAAPGGFGPLQKLAQGKNVGFMDALPFIAQIFGPANANTGEAPKQSPNRSGANWDS